VNRTFEQLIGEPQASLFEPSDDTTVPSEWVDLATARSEIDSIRHPVTILGGPVQSLVSSERRRLESEEVAATILAAVRDGWPVQDGDTVRPARFGDIALLIPSRTPLEGIEAAFETLDLTYKVQSSMLIYRSNEVRDLLACLRAIESVGDETAVVAALRTPEFACADDELADYRRSRGQWRIDALIPPGFEDHRVSRALAELAELHHARHERGLVGSLEAIVRERRVLQLAAGLKRREEAWRRIARVLDDARAFVEAGGRSIGDFLAWTDHQGERVTRSAELVDRDEDAISILTIHGAKGLEFPIVVLADLGARPPGARGPRVLAPPGARPEARARAGLETIGYAALASADDHADDAEQLRLCYVAATRARDHLVVSLHHDPAGGKGSLAAQLWSACSDDPSGFGRGLPVASARSPLRGAESGDGVLVARGASIEARRVARAALLERNRRSASVIASDLEEPDAVRTGPPASGTRGAEFGRDRNDEPAGERIGWHARRAATELGRAVHAVLQRVDLVDGDDLPALAAIESARHGVSEQQVVNFARSALATDIVREASAATTLHREMPVTARVGGGVVEGIVDLLFLDEDRSIVVVDYKTDALDQPGEVVEAAQRYRLQVGAYALALELVLGRPVGRCVLVFLAPPDGAIPHTVQDVAAAVKDAETEIIDRLSPGR
jgi:ATP-dependent exoDNAse (exonuclease V) beta subunit